MNLDNLIGGDIVFNLCLSEQEVDFVLRLIELYQLNVRFFVDKPSDGIMEDLDIAAELQVVINQLRESENGK